MKNRLRGAYPIHLTEHASRQPLPDLVSLGILSPVPFPGLLL